VVLLNNASAFTTTDDIPSNKVVNSETIGRASAIQKSDDSSNSCAPREGLVICNVVGRLANDLVQVAFANRLSQELCWPVVYRKWWDAEFPSPRGYKCFPRAHLPRDPTRLPSSTSLLSMLEQSVQLNASTWKRWSQEGGQRFNNEYQEWVANNNRSISHLKHGRFDFTGTRVDDFITNVKSSSSDTRVVSMEAFFIHYDWMKDYMPRIRKWLTISPECCLHDPPPKDAVVIHVRDFDPQDVGYKVLQPSAYVEIIRHYEYTERPLWIVCQPQSVNSTFVQEISQAAASAKQVTIVTGVDQYDAFCTLMRAKTLILSYVSSYSQMAALLNTHGDDVRVHYPLPTLKEPKVTLAVPGWKYHLVNATMDGIEQWDVGYEQITPTMA
jgi:hypothetical protein